MIAQAISPLRFLLAASLLVGAGVFLHSRAQSESLPSRQDLDEFPLRFGDWEGRDLFISPEVRKVLGEGEFLQRIYRRPPEGVGINLFMAFFPTQRTGSTIHSPQNCLPGAGWTPIDSGQLRLSGPGGGELVVNRYILARGLERLLVLYWYQSHGRVEWSEYWAKIYLVADSVRMNRSDGALVRIITPLGPEEGLASGEKRAAGFAASILPLLNHYIPL